MKLSTVSTESVDCLQTDSQGTLEVLVQFKRIGNHNLQLPAYQSAEAAGFDLRSNEEVILVPGKVWLCPTGFACAIQKGYEGQIRPRSGLASKHMITVINSPGTIDSDYRGEVKIALINQGIESFKIEYGMRVAQMVIAPVAHAQLVEVDELDSTVRGEGGFGSTKYS
jgi:dUTP pyrophosphatase